MTPERRKLLPAWGRLDARHAALDGLGVRELLPVATRSAGDRDVAEAIGEVVAHAAGPAVPALGFCGWQQAVVALGQADRWGHRLVVHPHAPRVRAVVHLEYGH